MQVVDEKKNCSKKKTLMMRNIFTLTSSRLGLTVTILGLPLPTAMSELLLLLLLLLPKERGEMLVPLGTLAIMSARVMSMLLAVVVVVGFLATWL